MGPSIIARNYAETLLALAQKHGGDEAIDEYADAIDQVSDLLQTEPRFRTFLETPRIGVESKKRAVRATFDGRVPEHFLRFLLIVVAKRRQTLIGEIADEYHTLLDQLRGRVRVGVTLAQPSTPEIEREIVETLQRKLGKTVVPSFEVDKELVGGIVVRVGDQILDGSMRRRLANLRRRLLEVRLPETTPVNSTQG